MKREYLFILITIVVAVSGLIYKGMFVSDTLNNAQNLIIENNDRHAKFKRDTTVQGNVGNLVELYNINKRPPDKEVSYGVIIAELLKITEDILKESKIKYDENDIGQEQETIKNKDWPNRKETFYINVNFDTNYTDLIRFINIIENHQLLINIKSMTYSRSRKRTNSKKDKNDKVNDPFSIKLPLNVKARLEYIKFL
ncbi:MAG: hypothetical protein GQ534_10780 [Candidatus Delongbacteria bacterium]|nr:hypothetical protein [Candidatus Delongbacteria bacterium]